MAEIIYLDDRLLVILVQLTESIYIEFCLTV